MKLITPELLQRFEQVGDAFESKNPLIVAKFFNPCGSQSWYAIAYYPETKTCYGYVTGMFEDEWGNFSIEELEAVALPFGLGIERDLYFKEVHFNELTSNSRLSQLENNKSHTNHQEIEP